MCQCGKMSGTSFPNGGQTTGTGSTGGSDFDSQLAKLQAMQNESVRRNFEVQKSEVEFSGKRRASQQQFA
jgi:hypothetical protein